MTMEAARAPRFDIGCVVVAKESFDDVDADGGDKSVQQEDKGIVLQLLDGFIGVHFEQAGNMCVYTGNMCKLNVLQRPPCLERGFVVAAQEDFDTGETGTSSEAACMIHQDQKGVVDRIDEEYDSAYILWDGIDAGQYLDRPTWTKVRIEFMPAVFETGCSVITTGDFNDNRGQAVKEYDHGVVDVVEDWCIGVTFENAGMAPVGWANAHKLRLLQRPANLAAGDSVVANDSFNTKDVGSKADHDIADGTTGWVVDTGGHGDCRINWDGLDSNYILKKQFRCKVDIKKKAIRSLQECDQASEVERVRQALWIKTNKFYPDTGHTITCLAFSQDSKCLVTGGTNKSFKVWKREWYLSIVLSDWEYMAELEAMAFSPDGSFLATVSKGTPQMWSTEWGRTNVHEVLACGEGKFLAVAFSPDLKFLGALQAKADGHVLEVLIQRDSQWKLEKSLKAPAGARALNFSPDSRFLASGGQILCVWDTTSWGVVAGTEDSCPIPEMDFVNGVAFSPNGKFLACASSDTKTHILEISSWSKVSVLEGHSQPVNALAFYPDGSILVTAGGDKTTRIYESWTWEEVKVLQSDDNDVKALAFSPDGKLLATAGAANAQIWSIQFE